MTSIPVLGFASLPHRHPNLGVSFLHMHAPNAIVRLAIAGSSSTSREVAVRWVRRIDGEEEELTRTLDWTDLPDWGHTPDSLVAAVAPQDRTAWAAIGVMALLIHDLEAAEITEVLSIGSGGDYNVRVAGASHPIQLEGSGIEKDETGKETRDRVSEKKAQVLTHEQAGFVSVTTFEYRSSGVFSRLLFVKKDRKRRR